MKTVTIEYNPGQIVLAANALLDTAREDERNGRYAKAAQRHRAAAILWRADGNTLAAQAREADEARCHALAGCVRKVVPGCPRVREAGSWLQGVAIPVPPSPFQRQA